ncbi:MAG: phosphate acyltransferase [Candidatus Algichlamydia australiensis]|nr:phosphate acyltransferase [Chlamydiales bacterium]
MQIGIDLMGGETSPALLIQAIDELARESDSPLKLTIFASKEVLSKLPQNCGSVSLTPVVAADLIEMADDPLKAVRQKPNASMILGIKALKEGKIDAFVSTGNTGALIASSTLTLGRIESISMPALLALLPTKKNPLALIDAGASTEADTKQLLASAKMGLAYQYASGNKQPKIGLLNIGTEEYKGHDALKKAYSQLKNLPEFVGNIEGSHAFEGKVDVLVTDGFTGNVFLKTAEGVAAMLIEQMAEKPKKLIEKTATGALVCGVDGIVIKCHGSADPKALKNGVKLAANLTNGNFLNKLKSELKR